MYHLLGFRSRYDPKFKTMLIFVLLARIFKEVWVKRAACIAFGGKFGRLIGLALQKADFTAQGQLGRCPNTSSLNIYLVICKTCSQLYFPNDHFSVWGSCRPYLIWHYSLQQKTSAKNCWSKWGKWWGSWGTKTKNINIYITSTYTFLTLILTEWLHFLTCYSNSLVCRSGSSGKVEDEKMEDRSFYLLCSVKNNSWNIETYLE